MKNMKFLPWVGNSYRAGFNGIRTLVLGESHYQWKCDRNIETWRDVTTELIEDQISGQETKSFWTHIVTAFINREPSTPDKASFWHSVAFYNYVQESAGDGPRKAPPEGSWGRSETPFKEVLEALHPQLIVVLGRRLWWYLPEWGSPGPRVIGAPYDGTWIYPLSRGSALAFGVRHPSSGFSGLAWHQHIMAALSLAKACALNAIPQDSCKPGAMPTETPQ